MKKVNPGDHLEIPAATYNAFIDAAREVQSRPFDTSNRPRPFAASDATIITVRNSSDVNRDRFDVLYVSSPIFSPTDSLEAFQREIVFDGRLPSTNGTPPPALYLGKIAILVEPVRAGGLGRAIISGVTVIPCTRNTWIRRVDARLADIVKQMRAAKVAL